MNELQTETEEPSRRSRLAGFSWRPRRSRVKTGFTTQDLVHEALEGVAARPSRLIITLVGTVLGIASLVLTIGLAQTAAGQISQKFDSVTATRVTVEPGKADGPGNTERVTQRLPWDAVERVSQIAGVEGSTLIAELSQGLSVDAVQVQDPGAVPEAPPKVIAASAGLMDVVSGSLSTGRFFDEGHAERGDRVVVLGKKAAEKLGINRVTGQPAIFIDDRAYTVIGILDEVGVRETLLDSAIVPITTARQQLGLTKPQNLDIRIQIGAGPVVAKQAPIALNPNSPEGFKIGAPASMSELQGSMEADFNVLFIAIGAVALLGGGIGIANVTLLSVAERRSEIGLRRALGARTKHIAQQFMLESLITGVLGGLIGVSVGLIGLLIISVIQEWTPVVSWWAAPAGVVVGAIVGLAAGTYPALKAARIEPVDALRDAR
ncbi:ABC transporter permease [Leucobacter chinensis]|uniref:ABC transporter permease n=1 Tax=Leucobacter chinensis TaxID=2851010 RepID=UPI001C23794F